MLRSLGSTLVARSSPGTALRSKDETRADGAVNTQTSGAQPENVQREIVKQPLERSVPEGTVKQVATAPALKERMTSGDQSSMGLVPQMGGASQAAATGVPLRSNSSPTAVAGAATSKGAAGYSAKTGQMTTTSQSVDRPNDQFQTPGLLGMLGLRTVAGDNTPYKSVDLGTAIKGATGKAIDTVGKALGNPFPEKSISEKLQSVGPQQVKQATNTVKNAIVNAANNAPQNILRSIQQATQSAGNVLRSLFGKR